MDYSKCTKQAIATGLAAAALDYALLSERANNPFDQLFGQAMTGYMADGITAAISSFASDLVTPSVVGWLPDGTSATMASLLDPVDAGLINVGLDMAFDGIKDKTQTFLLGAGGKLIGDKIISSMEMS